MRENDEDIRYPIGRYQRAKKCTRELQQEWIIAIAALPRWLNVCIEDFSEKEFHTPYRDGGWTVQQVVHHLADVHMNAYIRLKLALTETNPIIKPYDENLWAVLADVEKVPAGFSVAILTGLHYRWAETLRNMKNTDWKRTYYHPEQNRDIPLWEMVALYAWHGSHHVAQIRHFHLNERKRLQKITNETLID